MKSKKPKIKQGKNELGREQEKKELEHEQAKEEMHQAELAMGYEQDEKYDESQD